MCALLMVAGLLSAEELPTAITSYYDDWNFVASNSTLHQREVLWSAYQQSITRELSGTDQQIIVRMDRILRATEPQKIVMPMLLAATVPPVTQEILVPSSHIAQGDGEFIVRVMAMQTPVAEPAHGHEPTSSPSRLKNMTSMCQYTDRWVDRDGSWKVIRSAYVWVDAQEGPMAPTH